ncbi:NADH-quinone oxidoreductase subunit NuoF [Desulfobacter vibrioformis]|uniref:NADH-quinone oxidoreductase subunit NuoF n=1 Tax=Desulfobacter vibrioformis TaxID=34031 RepID=UPI0012EB39EC|nr:NADH-quinone oxidoreductase subunit NuoF [Desulfobacter vibrioformis]
MISQSVRTQINRLCARYPRKESALMPALSLMQRENENVLTRAQIRAVAKAVGVSAAKAFGVATFYTMYNVGGTIGKYHLQVDTNIPATLMGGLEILAHLEKILGIKAGESTADGLFTLTAVECLGSCGTCPVIQVNDVYYENMTFARTDELIASLRKGVMPRADPTSFFYTEPGILLKNRGQPSIAPHDYAALDKALGMAPDVVRAEVTKSLLRGRGGAGFPAGTKWGFLTQDATRPVYLVCNADEGEPGTFKDRQIMQYDPHLLIEGIAIAAHAIGARTAFIYIRGEFGFIADVLEKAIARAPVKHIDIVVHRGAGSYVCGDETALMESIEGKRGNPRPKPPFPANIGLYGCPTIINNVETLSCLPYIVTHGADAFKKIGTVGNSGPKIYSVSGQVNKPGAFEFPMGVTLDKVLAAAGGVKGTLKAVIVGGLSVPILTAQEAKGLVLDYASCVKAGTLLGSGGIMVMNDTVSIPQVALRTIAFYAHESCGQCVPCREGSNLIKNRLSALVKGTGTHKDIDLILKICAGVKGLTLCPLGEAFAMPVEAMVKKFRPEFEALVKF